jgi:hypothetical protein
MRRLFDDAEVRADQVRRGYDRVARFTWRATAERTLEAYGAAIARA